MTGIARTAAFCAMALVGFAANSLLTRLALRPRLIDAATFAAVRVTTGAAALALLARLRKPPAALRHGSWTSALWLFAYVAPFSFAYLRMGAGVGALILFGSVQITMIGWGLLRGERPRAGEWLGLLLALVGLGVLTLPGAERPDLTSLEAMGVAGVAWGAYSLRGRNSRDALAATAGNFVRCTPFALGLAAASWLVPSQSPPATITGVALAAASGALASGIAYTLWYAALPGLSSLVAGLVQLTVPILAATLAVVLLDEQLTGRLAAAGALVLCGVTLVLWTRARARPTAAQPARATPAPGGRERWSTRR
jgi:drug/metabolite transporter (DMT)-like permease